jgi:hypothetical protein
MAMVIEQGIRPLIAPPIIAPRHRALLRSASEELFAQPGDRGEAERVANRRDAEQVEAEQDHDAAPATICSTPCSLPNAAGRDQHGAEQSGDQADAGIDADARQRDRPDRATGPSACRAS